ncbi:MAG: LytR C-terminal domain-containing protein [Nitrospirae bacterium]|nr:LytR C-terminal domain-containing protein [Nitrospirota bacterium]
MKRHTAPRRLAAAILGLTVCCSTLPAFALSIKVLNGTRTTGRAAQMGSFLKKHGFTVSKVDKADKIFDSTVIYYKDGARDDAKKIADLMPSTQSIKPLSWESQFDLIIVVGNDHSAQGEPSAEPSQEPPAPQSVASTTSEEAPSPDPNSGKVTSTPPASAEPEVPEVEEEREAAGAPTPGEAAGEAAETAPPTAPKPAAPAKPAATGKPKVAKPKSTKPASPAATRAAPTSPSASKAAAKTSSPAPKPEPAGYTEIGAVDLMKQVADHIGKNVRVQDEFMDQSNYFLGMKDHGIGPEEYVEFFSGENRVNLIIYIAKSNRDALGTLNALKRGDKVIVHGKVFAKNPIGRPLLMADRLDRG